MSGNTREFSFIGICQQENMLAVIERWQVLCNQHNVKIARNAGVSQEYGDCYGQVGQIKKDGTSRDNVWGMILQIFRSKHLPECAFNVNVSENLQSSSLLLQAMQKENVVLWENCGRMSGGLILLLDIDASTRRPLPSVDDWIILLRKLEGIARQRGELLCLMDDTISRYLKPIPPGPNEWAAFLLQMALSGSDLTGSEPANPAQSESG